MNYLSSAHEFSTRFFLSGLPRGTKAVYVNSLIDSFIILDVSFEEGER